MLLNGDNSVTGGLQTVNGFAKGNFFIGVGTGLDYYSYRSVPVFADFRYQFGHKVNKVFLYGDAGINCNWVQEEFHTKPTIWNGNQSNKFKNGLYTDAGIGLNAGVKNGNAFVLSLGYSKKNMAEEVTQLDWRSNEFQTDTRKYRFNRIVFKIGFRF